MIAARPDDVRAPDGSPVAVFATFPPGNAPAYISARLAPESTVLDLGCGAGRIALPLAAAGHHVTGVDVSAEMIAALLDPTASPSRPRFVVRIGAESAPIPTTKRVGEEGGAGAGTVEGVVGDIDGLELGRTFDAVVLASYLVNDADQARAGRFLDTCRRHVRPSGQVFVQRHHPEFLDGTDVIESAEDGYGFRYQRISRAGDTVTGRMTYLHDDRQWEQQFVTTILDDTAFFAALERGGLRFARWLDEFETWAEAVPA